MATPLVRDADRQLIDRERAALDALRGVLSAAGAAAGSIDALDRSIRQLDGLFLLVVAGEFNSGKSAFINALLGEPLLEEGVTPTTAQVHLLQYGESRSRVEQSAHLHVITAPVDLLRDMHLVDTPGTNAVIREHEAITAAFLPRADLVLFVTSVDRPFTESERQFLGGIREWGKKIVIVLNKVDLIDADESLQQVVSFVSEGARRFLGVAPEIFPVSARLALRAKRGHPELLAASRFDALESYVFGRLDERERLRLKLANPLGVGRALARRYGEVVDGRLDLLRDDLALLEDVERQQDVHRADMRQQFEARMSAIDNVLLELEGRGHAYFDEMLRIGRVFDLLNRSRVQEGFEREVVGSAPAGIERRVSDLVDWLVSTELRQWQQVTMHIARRRDQYRERIVGDPEVASFHLERNRLLESVGRDAQQAVESFDRRREAAALADRARNAVAAAAAVGAGALGLGAIVTAAASTAAADVTGILLAGVIATLGFYVIPARRRKVKQELRAKIARLRETLAGALRTHFAAEMERGTTRLQESIAPYSRFVRAEQRALDARRDALRQLQNELEALEQEVRAIA